MYLNSGRLFCSFKKSAGAMCGYGKCKSGEPSSKLLLLAGCHRLDQAIFLKCYGLPLSLLSK